ncbi:PmoA family protein [Streptomyces sp. N2-109]|uniref:PmoA family protein n=1 Tax=Streptomyces gossypii TaxID=2883101 RepID=A0ABT2JUH5_9ACTN|nr:PmoA family protein [Streptomyces gossypii]MCT2591552.1 PmoA family protein [Streptomyces gossypii]
MPDALFGTRRSDDETELTVTVAGTDIAQYVYRPDTPDEESPKPYLHPIRTLSGAPVSVYRPWDHRWHKGLQLTWSHLSGDNFWGGPTFEQGAPGHGYVWRNNHGSQQHNVFDTCDSQGTQVSIRHQLDWISSTGGTWMDERRSLRFHSADLARGVWALDFATDLTNVHTEPLRMGSPTTHGRPNAGYTGLFWRGPRSWTGAALRAAGGHEGDAVMGAEAAWAAISGEHDDTDGAGTVLALAGTSSASVPLKWFARSEPFACLNASPAYDTEIKLAPGEALSLRHRFVFIDSACERDELQWFATEFAL